MIGQPATDAFCTSSNESRPLTQRMRSASGRRALRGTPSPRALSSALCRPTSSRAQRSSAARREETGGMSPRSRRTHAAPSAAAREVTTRDLRRPAARSPREARRRDCLIAPCRRHRTRTTCRSAAGGAPGRGWWHRPRPCWRQGHLGRASSGVRPSVRQKPRASSSSCPGVRIVTATGSPPIRISSGSSTARTSSPSSPR